MRRRLAGIALALAVILVNAPPARNAPAGTDPPAPAPANQVPFEATLGGTTSISGFQLPGLLLTVQATGVGRASAAGQSSNASVSGRASVDVTQNPPAVKNGVLTITAPGGEQLHATFEGQLSAPDASGSMNVSGTYTITGGTGPFVSARGTGTVSGVVNFMHSAFSLTAQGNAWQAGTTQ